MTETRVILASGSPRRLELLAQIGLQAGQQAPDVDETPLANECARDYTRRLAIDKAHALPAAPGQVVVAADTAIEHNQKIYGKPLDAEDFRHTLATLAGQWHSVWTSVAVVGEAELQSCSCETRIRLRPLGYDQIDRYWRSGEPVGKAGGYAIQGLGAVLVERMEGSYSNVVGLPLCEVSQMLARAGVVLPLGENV